MGATNFETIGRGRTARDAFHAAAEEARYEHGHGGYTGTIAEKHAFVEIRDTVEDLLQRVKAARIEPYFNETPAEVEARRAQTLKTLADAAKGNETRRAHAVAQALMDLNDRRINDKWGPAGAIKLADGEWLFFGWASE